MIRVNGVQPFNGLTTLMTEKGDISEWVLHHSDKIKELHHTLSLVRHRMLRHGLKLSAAWVDLCCTYRAPLEEYFPELTEPWPMGAESSDQSSERGQATLLDVEQYSVEEYEGGGLQYDAKEWSKGLVALHTLRDPRGMLGVIGLKAEANKRVYLLRPPFSRHREFLQSLFRNPSLTMVGVLIRNHMNRIRRATCTGKVRVGRMK